MSSSCSTITVLSEDTSITHVVHLGDIHVRIGNQIHSRSREYESVFSSLLETLLGLPCVRRGRSLLVIAGDVFHNKGRLETEGAVVFFRWMNRVLEAMPVLVICGNHDFRQEDPAYCDMVEMLVTPYQGGGGGVATGATGGGAGGGRHPIHYLRETGLYRWGDIGFSVVSVKDTLRAFNTRGMVSDLPPFPCFGPEDGAGLRRRVALFHGSVTQSALPNGRLMPTEHGYPLEWFRGHDIAMLGDNHKQQLHTDGLDGTLQWGYPGSLVQQDDGEPTFGHGFLLWNLTKNRGKAYHVANEFGAFTMRQDNKGNWRVRFGIRDTVALEKAIARDGFPLRPKVRVIGSRGDDIYALEALAKYGITPSSVRLSHPGPEEAYGSNHPSPTGSSGSEDSTEGEAGAHRGGAGAEEDDDAEEGPDGRRLVDLNTPERWEAYLRMVMPADVANTVAEWVHQPARMLLPADRYRLPPELMQKVAVRNTGIQKALDLFEAEVGGSREQLRQKGRRSICLKRMRWDYLMCYGKDNWFDFEAMDGRIGLLNGRNASGKSSFLDVLCIALFGEPTKSRREFSGSKMTSKIIHDKKPKGNTESAHVALLFQADDRYYELHRIIVAQSASSNKVRNRTATLYKVARVAGEDGTGPARYERRGVVADGTTMVDKWVEGVFGDIREVLMSTIVCQADKDNFFFQKDDDQKVLLERALHMSTISAFETVLDEAYKAYRYMLAEVSTYVRGLTDSREGRTVEGGEETVCALRDRVRGLESAYNQGMAAANALLERTGTVREVEASPLSRASDEALAAEERTVAEALAGAEGGAAGAAGTPKDELLVREGRLRMVLEGLDGEARDGGALTLAQAEAVMARHAGWVPGSGLSRGEVTAKAREYAAWLARVGDRFAEVTAADLAQVAAELAAAQEDLRAIEPVPRPTLPRPAAAAAGAGVAALAALWEAYQARVKEREGLPAETGQRRSREELEAILARARTIGAEEERDCRPELLEQMARALGNAKGAGEPDKAALATWRGRATEDLVRELGEMEEEYQSLLAEEVHSTRPKEGLARWQKELGRWEALVAALGPGGGAEGDSGTMQARIEEVRAYLSKVEGLREQAEDLRKRHEALAAEVAELDQAPFNPECWACCQQPSAVRRKERAAELARVATALKKQDRAVARVDWDGAVAEMRTELADLVARLPLQEKYEARCEEMAAETAEWEAAARAWEAMAARTERLSALRAGLGGARAVLARRYEAARTARSALDQREQAAQELAALTAVEAWRAGMAEAHWRLWEATRVAREGLEKKVMVLSEKHQEWERYLAEAAAWEGVLAAVALERERWEAHDTIEWHRASAELAEVGAALARVAAQEALVARGAMVARVRAYREWRGASEALAATGAELDRARVELVSVERAWEEQRRWSDRVGAYMAAMNDIRDRFGWVSALRTAFVGAEKASAASSGAGASSGFKSWVYEKEVIPLIEGGVNRFLENLDDFRLRIEYQEGRFLFLVEDRGNRPTLDHCSGYQKFLVGLGMRAALARIGAVGQNVKHLFLDEAFVACDADNIQKVSDILHEMMATGGYRSVLLMSHLDTIRDTTGVCINIERAPGSAFSLIRWGEPTPVAAAPGAAAAPTEEAEGSQEASPSQVAPKATRGRAKRT